MRGVLYLSGDRMKVTKWAGAAVAGAMMMAGPGTAGAVVVLDQLSQVPNVTGKFTIAASVGYFDPAYSFPRYAGTRVSFSQGMTAGARGKLDHIDFSHGINFSSWGLPTSGLLVVSLFDGDYATGARTLVGQSMFDFASVGNGITNGDPNLLNFTFQTSSFNYRVKDGQAFSVLFDTTSNTSGLNYFNRGYGDFDLSTITPNISQYYGSNYTGGKFQFYLDGTAISPPEDVADSDLTFASYVDTSGGVPEPATWALMIFGFGGIGAALRRRGKRVSALA